MKTSLMEVEEHLSSSLQTNEKLRLQISEVVDAVPSVSSTETYLGLESLSVSYGDLMAVEGISLGINQGELFTFLGPSGSGKTTVLLSVAGFVPPTYGNIWLNGENITTKAPYKRDFGLVFQSYTLFPHKTVYENIAYPLVVRRTPKHEIREKVSSLLATIQLEGSERKLPRELSGGQQQRVALARALVFGPRLLLLDEPLGSLDKKLRETMQFEVRRLQRESRSTTLYVTHDQSEAMAISDRIGILRYGKLEQVGSPKDIYENPANAFVADFVGGANLVRARIVSIDGDNCTVKVAGSLVRAIPKPAWLSAESTNGLLMLRPTHLRASAGSLNNENEIACYFEETYYLGETNLVRCRLKDKSVVEVRQPTFQITMEPKTGSWGVIQVASRMARLFPDSLS